jgi:putative SOS response-associated peptidase YedK
MPLILPDALADKWLAPLDDELDQKALKELIRSFPQDPLQAHTVARLRGKGYAGNLPGISREVVYPELAV